jgi:hypothetical protein
MNFHLMIWKTWMEPKKFHNVSVELHNFSFFNRIKGIINKMKGHDYAAQERDWRATGNNL